VSTAKTIGIKPLELAKELRAGKTIAEVATEHGVQPQTVIDALKTAATAKIEKAKAAGKITPERAAKLEARLDKIVPKFVNDWHLKAKAATAG
jgi:transposase-like protein